MSNCCCVNWRARAHNSDDSNDSDEARSTSCAMASRVELDANLDIVRARTNTSIVVAVGRPAHTRLIHGTVCAQVHNVVVAVVMARLIEPERPYNARVTATKSASLRARSPLYASACVRARAQSTRTRTRNPICCAMFESNQINSTACAQTRAANCSSDCAHCVGKASSGARARVVDVDVATNSLIAALICTRAHLLARALARSLAVFQVRASRRRLRPIECRRLTGGGGGGALEEQTRIA